MRVQKILLVLAMTILPQTMNAKCAEEAPIPQEEAADQQLQMAVVNNFFTNLLATDAKIKETLSESENNPEAIRAFVVGITGAGKSTLVNSLYGNPLRMDKTKKGSFVLNPGTGENILPVGEGSNSVTKVPGILYDTKEGIVYCDCPGFGDTQGDLQEALNAFAIDSLFSQNVPVSVVYVINYHDTESERYNAVKDSSGRVFELFNQDVEKLERSLSGVVSRIPPDLEANAQIEELKDFNPVMSILYSNSDRVFSFPEPDRREDKDGEQYNKFTKRADLINFIKTHSVKGMDHTVPLGKDAQDALCAAIYATSDMITFSRRFGDAILAEVETSAAAKDITQLEQWLVKANEIKAASIKNIDDFARVTQGTLPPTFAPFYEEIEKIRGIGKFVSQRIQNKLVAKACGQDMVDEMDRDLDIVVRSIKLRIGVLKGEIAVTENERLTKELVLATENARISDKKSNAKYESMIIQAGDGWFTRAAKNFRQLCVGASTLLKGFGTAVHNAVFGPSNKGSLVPMAQGIVEKILSKKSE